MVRDDPGNAHDGQDAGVKLMADTTNYVGQQGVIDANDLHSIIAFHIHQAMGLARTGTPVKVVKVHGGGVGPPPTVDVLPLVNQIDGLGKATKHDTVYGISVQRLQAGKSVIIADPVVGDIGWLAAGDRDMSAVKVTGKQSNPGSFRRHSLSDGVYHPGIINPGNPNQWIQFKTTGIVIHDVNGNEIGLQNTDPHIYLKPASGNVYLGGDGTSGTYDFVETVSGPSSNVKAKL